MSKEITEEALEIGLLYVISDGYTRYQNENANTIRLAIEELNKPKPYTQFGQENTPEVCLTCGLQCPTDCPLDKDEE